MEILEKVESSLPKGVVSRIELEGCEIIVYTNSKEFFLTHEEVIRNIVSQLKKRIEVRVESGICLDKEATKKIILEIVPPEAKIHNIYFEDERSLVIISAEKPGLVIGKGGETFREIRQRTFWVPRIERIPAIKSNIVEGIRNILHQEVKFRKAFLNKIGKNIFTERKTNRDWIRITGLGGWGEVGRSCILLETPKSKVLIDCGINVGGSNANMLPIFHAKEFDYNELDAIIISHTHLDHCGAVPILYEYGYDGPLYCTTPTIDLATLLWLDYIDVMQKSMAKPLFSVRGVKEAVKHTIALDYEEVSDVAPDVRLTFMNAGHVLGSALIHLHIGEGLHNILYALDQKFGRTALLEPAHTDFQRNETLIIESTYGKAEDIMPSRKEAEKQLMDVINKTMERKGIALIPTFAVERAQEVMTILVENNFQYPVYIDGMIWDANGIFTAYPEYLSRNMRKKIFAGENPFVNPMFKRIASSNEREKAWEDKPCVIISTSGMLVGGPAIEHLKALAEDEKNTLIFTGYQCEGTMGRRIQKGWKEIPFKTEEGKTITLPLKMEVQTIDGLSVSWDTPIVIKENGLIKVLPIGSLVDKYLPSEGVVEVKNIEVPSFGDNGKISFKPAKYLIKHRSKGKLLEIITKSGRRVKVSKGHSLFILKDGSIKTVPSSEITVGDYIIIPKKIPANPSIGQINFVDFLKDKINSNEYKILNGQIYRKKGKMKYGPLKTICNDMCSLAKFIGYFLAEGDAEENYRVKLSFGRHEKVLIEDSTNVIKNAFGINPHFRYLQQSETQVCINSKLIHDFLELSGCNGNAYTKRVPFFVFNLPKEAQLECISAYFAGDGYIDSSEKRKYIVGKSVNLNLLSDIAYLLLQHEIIARIKGPYEERERILNGKIIKKTKTYKLLVLGDKLEKFKKKRLSYPPFALPIKEIKLDKISSLITDPKLRKSAKNYVYRIEKGRKHVGIDIVTKFLEKIDERKADEEQKAIIKLLKIFTEGDITVDIVSRINEVEGSEFEYDISVEGDENFCGGVGGIMLHNSGHSGRNQLLAYIGRLTARPEKVIVVHGENQKAVDFAKAVQRIFRIEAIAPKNLEAIRLK
jgi:KH/beta-lactamase-domain protein